MGKLSDLFRKSTGGLKSAVKASAPAMTKVAGSAANVASAAGTAVQGAVWEGSRQVADSAFDAIKDPGFVLFIAGLFAFFTGFFESTVLVVFVGTLFLFFTALYIFKGKSIITVTAFWVLYVFLGVNADLMTLIYYFAASLVAGVLVHGLVTKFKAEGFAKGATEELVGGL
ncbi:hypothetical protein HZC32_00155, partial [Candidatus Woesearchaeota archaeon]|nr:hypothetical protein [Candidatus Woesearchaeota archaeon]